MQEPPSPKRCHSQVLGQGSRLSVSLIWGYQKNRAESACIARAPPCVNSSHKQRGPTAAFNTAWYCTLEPARTQQKGKQEPALFRWQPDKPPLQPGCHCSLALPLPPSLPRSLISLCPGQACVWVGVFKPITQREDVDLLWEGELWS